MRVVSSMGNLGGGSRILPVQQWNGAHCSSSLAPLPQFGLKKRYLFATLIVGIGIFYQPLKKAYNFASHPIDSLFGNAPKDTSSLWQDIKKQLPNNGQIVTHEEHTNTVATPLSSEPLKRLREDMEGGAYFLMLAHSVSLSDITRVYNDLHSKQPVTDEQLKQVCQDPVENWNAIPKGTTFDLGQLPSETSTNVKQ